MIATMSRLHAMTRVNGRWESRIGNRACVTWNMSKGRGTVSRRPHPFHFSNLEVMPRTSNLARNARRAFMMINGQFHLYDDDATYDEQAFRCPYCDHALKSTSDRDRHIMMKPCCRTKHLQSLANARRARREREYQRAGPSSRPYAAASGSGSGAHDHNGAEPRYNDPRRWDDNGRTCHKPYVQHFPISTAGKPISRHRTHPVDLGAYLESCGNLSKPTNMEAAELMMTNGLSAGGRTRFLRSSFVSLMGDKIEKSIAYQHFSIKAKHPGEAAANC